MKRKTLLAKLEKNLPSFSLHYIKWGKEVDKAEDRSWLFSDENNPTLAERIPEDYLVGIQAMTSNGVHYTSRRREDRENERMVKLEIMDFGYYGNTHKYGELYIDGVEWKAEETGTIRFCSELREINPLVSYAWNVKLCKIIRPQDGFFEQDGYESGSSTQRFTDLSELYATAAYVALYRVLGPFSLYEGSFCTVPKKKDLILSVDDQDNVSIGRELKHYWNQYFEKN